MHARSIDYRETDHDAGIGESLNNRRGPRKAKLAVIDTDIHNFDVYEDPVFNEVITNYLAQEWQEYHKMIGMRGHYGGGYPRAQPNAARTDAWPPSGRPPGTDLEFMREQLLDAWDMDYGILNPLAGAGGQVNREYGAQLARGHQRLPDRRMAGT